MAYYNGFKRELEIECKQRCVFIIDQYNLTETGGRDFSYIISAWCEWSDIADCSINCSFEVYRVLLYNSEVTDFVAITAS